MLVYRVFRYRDDAKVGENGHPEFVWKQTNSGRFDNGDIYTAWYVASDPVAAICETLGNFKFWDDSTFLPAIPVGSRLALAEFYLPDDSAIFDFDNPQQLTRISMRPSEVVIRNRPLTQGKAREIFQERHPSSTERAWHGLSWWSYHNPKMNVLAILAPHNHKSALELSQVTPLDKHHRYVLRAADILNREIR